MKDKLFEEKELTPILKRFGDQEGSSTSDK